VQRKQKRRRRRRRRRSLICDENSEAFAN